MFCGPHGSAAAIEDEVHHDGATHQTGPRRGARLHLLCRLGTQQGHRQDRLQVEEALRAVKVTVLSTMLAGNPGRGIGEWGFAALLEVDGRRLLLDTGERPETVLRNAGELGIDLSDLTDLVITHNHGDHTAGLVTLRRELAEKNPRALSRAHVARGIFDRRPGANGAE